MLKGCRRTGAKWRQLVDCIVVVKCLVGERLLLLDYLGYQQTVHGDHEVTVVGKLKYVEEQTRGHYRGRHFWVLLRGKHVRGKKTIALKNPDVLQSLTAINPTQTSNNAASCIPVPTPLACCRASDSWYFKIMNLFYH